ncbi:MAG: exported protein of unknown function [Nitrospira sp.]|jgi:hypothetical protein|nr:exported protein of unknown function [Nitrospira sp.]
MKKSLRFVFAFWMVMAYAANAGDYKLIVGESVELCEVCKHNLERMTEHPACERDYSGQLGLAAPDWRPFDVRGHLDALEQVVKYLATGSEFAEEKYTIGEPQYEDIIRTISTKEEPWAYLAQVDINNDGTLEPVLKLHSSLCHMRNDGSFGRAYSAPIVVLKENLSGIDRAMTELVMQNPPRKGRLPGETNYQLYGVFSYKGQTYFDRWNDTGSGDESERSTLSVYESRDGKTQKLCQLKELQVKRWFPNQPCAFRYCPPAKLVPVSLTP